jgi:hypothetical protein
MILKLLTKSQLKKNQLFSLDEATRYLPWRHPRTVARKINEGVIKGVITGKGMGVRYQVPAKAIEAYWQKRLQGVNK